jgi:hypothetical protein
VTVVTVGVTAPEFPDPRAVSGTVGAVANPTPGSITVADAIWPLTFTTTLRIACRVPDPPVVVILYVPAVYPDPAVTAADVTVFPADAFPEYVHRAVYPD